MVISVPKKITDPMGAQRGLFERIMGTTPMDAAADVQTRRAGGDDRITAFEQQARGHRQGLARLGGAGHLHEERLSRCEARDLP